MTMLRYLCSAVTIFTVLTLAGSAFAQKRLGKVCGNPSLPCKSRSGFQPYELPFDTGKKFVIVESEPFYAVILKSVRLKNPDDCENAIPETEPLSAQSLFSDKKVFVLRCSDVGQNYYTNTANDVSFMAVYAGKTRADAAALLKSLIARRKFAGATLRRMQAGINGT
jgi:hypothetical protein